MKRMRMMDRSYEGWMKVWWMFYVDENWMKMRWMNRMEGIFVRGCCVYWLGFMEVLILLREGIYGYNFFVEGIIVIVIFMFFILYLCLLFVFFVFFVCVVFSFLDCVLFCVVCLLEKCVRFVLVGFGLGFGCDWEYWYWVEGKLFLNGLD